MVRAVNSYLTNAGSELDTSAGATVNWQATYRLLVRADYSYMYSRFPLTPVGSALVDRLDHYQTGKIDVTYQVLRWLSIRPYVRYESRHTNVPLYAYNRQHRRHRAAGQTAATLEPMTSRYLRRGFSSI